MSGLVLLFAAANVAVSVNAGDLTDELEAMLRAEIQGLTITSSAAAEVRVDLLRVEESYVVDVSGPTGSMGARKTAVSEGTEPALRLATLLTARAIDAGRTLDDKVEIPPPPDNLTFYAFTGFFTGWWQRPFTPTIGFGGGIGADIETFAFGLLIFELGTPCCVRDIDRIEGNVSELIILADASFAPLRWGPVWLKLRASAGIDRVHSDPLPRFNFTGMGAPVRREATAVEGVLRGGASVDVELLPKRLFFGMGAGAWVRAAPFRLANLDEESLFSGNVVPYFEARLAFHIF